MTGRKKTTGTEIAKYNISKTISGEVDKVAKKNGRKIKVAYGEAEGDNNHWQIIARAMLKESANRMNIKGMEICVGVANRFSPTTRQKQAIIAIAKQHCPKVYDNIRLES